MAKGFSRTAPQVLKPSPSTLETQHVEALQDSLRARKDLRTCVPCSRLSLSCEVAAELNLHSRLIRLEVQMLKETMTEKPDTDKKKPRVSSKAPHENAS